MSVTNLGIKIVRFTLIILFGAYTLILYFNEQLLLYIHPRLLVFTAGMSALAVVVGIVGLVTTVSPWLKQKYKTLVPQLTSNLKELAHDKKLYLIVAVILASLVIGMAAFLILVVLLIPVKNSKLDHWLRQASWLLVLVFLVLGFGYLLPPRTLSPQAAAQTSAGLNSLVPNSSTVNAISLFNLDYTKYTIGDWIKSINLNPDLQSYEGKDIDVVGFVFRPESIDATQFLVSRFVISCCAVDARPVGLNVLSPEALEKFKPGDWVQVKGKYQVASIDGQDSLQIVPTEISFAEQPKNPYIY